jgi:hypothetical protein
VASRPGDADSLSDSHAVHGVVQRNVLPVTEHGNARQHPALMVCMGNICRARLISFDCFSAVQALARTRGTHGVGSCA